MEFPISVVIIEDRIVLCQGQITDEFRRNLNRVQYNRLGVEKIESVATPQLTYCIYINGTREHSHYNYVSIPFEQQLYDNYLRSIEVYKREMGYV